MEVADIKKIAGTLGYPFLLSKRLTTWTVAVFTGVVGYFYMSAFVAGVYVGTKRRCSTVFDCAYDLCLVLQR